MQFAQRQRCEQAKSIEMAAMIRDDDERAVRPQIFVPDNFETIVNAQQSANDQRTERAQSVNEHVRLARETAADDRSALDRDRARSRNATFSSERIIIAGHVHEQRRGVNQTVDPIENSAVTGNRCGHVFGADVALDHADGKIAELSADSDDQAGQNQLPRAEKWKRKAKQPGQNHGDAPVRRARLPRFCSD